MWGMSETSASIPQLLSELTRSLEDLQENLEPSTPRPPTPRQLARFTSEVTIPAVILVLETNVRALRLVQRALRIADGEGASTTDTQTRERAVKLGQATLRRLDSTLGDLQDALEGRPSDDDTRQLLERIRDIEADLETELEATAANETVDGVEIDVDAELQSLKDDVDGADDADDNE
jgi:hypothetical protein